jgi:cytosine/adenosine deaminase-related metal-dependent hydrolase
MILRGGTVITNNPRREILHDHSVRVSGAVIDALLPAVPDPPPEEVVDCSGKVVIPGFVQTHIHLCQTLFRGLADEFELLDWLQQRIFPFEAAHSEHSMHASAMLGIAELIRSGTTTILDMGSLRHEEEIIRAVGESGVRAHVGKAMMDVNDAFPPLRESTNESIRATRDLAERWHGSYDGRVRYAPAPRFVLSCSEEVMRFAGELVASHEGMIFHTHASENLREIETVRRLFGKENLELLNSYAVLTRRSCLAHCVHVGTRELDILASTGAAVAHCPSSNLKLASGIADVPALLARGITVGLGADGAPCNNSLDIFQEMRLASLLQKFKHGPKAMPAEQVFELATLGGAASLGLGREIGSIEPGKKADLVVLDLGKVWNPLGGNLYSSIVYSSHPENVDSVMIDGKWIYRHGEFTAMDAERIVAQGTSELNLLLGRLKRD